MATASSDANSWGISNPHGVVTIGNYLYVQDYDSNKIAIINMANNAYSRAATIDNVFPAQSASITPSGTGLDVYSFEDEETGEATTALIALYNQSDASQWPPAFGGSGIITIKVNGASYEKGTPITTLTVNASTLAVESDGASEPTYYAYITAFGAAQNAGGNGASSTLQVVRLQNSLAAPTLVQTIPANTLPSIFGDFVDAEIWGNYAYVLVANYNATWTQGTYRVIRTTAASLRGGNFGDYSNTGALTAPAGFTWLLGPATDVLWLVAGNWVYHVPSGTLSSTSLTPFGAVRADASNGTLSETSVGLGNTAVNGQLNTASVVIDRPVIAFKGAARNVVAKTKVSVRHEEFIKAAQTEAKK